MQTQPEQLAIPARAHDARAEIDRLMAELHRLVSRPAGSGRDAVEEALPTAAKLQVVTANVDACNPSRRPGIAAELVTIADRHARTRQDATERILVYTSDSTMRRLLVGAGADPVRRVTATQPVIKAARAMPGADPEARSVKAVARAIEGRRS